MEELALSIRGLKKSYANGFQALKGVDLDVSKGDFFALLGPNGAGKSTIIGVISSLVRKSEGRVSVFDCDLDQDPDGVKRYLGIVPQEFNFNQFEKVFDIVITQAGYYGIPPSIAKDHVEYYLRELGLWDKRGSPARELSGGMKRRLMIARALVHRPRLLILDEPTAGVDIELRRSMWGFLTSLNESGVTIILTTHYLEEAEQLCRNIAVIDNGLVVESTSMKSLLSKMDVDTFILEFDAPLRAVPAFLVGLATMLSESSLQVSISRSYGLTRLFSELAALGYTVNGLRNKGNRLEEFFISMVNKSSS